MKSSSESSGSWTQHYWLPSYSFLYQLNFGAESCRRKPLPIGTWCHAEMSLESPREMALIKETGREGDFRKGETGVSQKRHRLARSAAGQILPRRATKGFSEGPCQINGVYAKLLRQPANQQRLATFVPQKLFRQP